MRKLFLLLICIMMLCSVASVSAVDNETQISSDQSVDHPSLSNKDREIVHNMISNFNGPDMGIVINFGKDHPLSLRKWLWKHFK